MDLASLKSKLQSLSLQGIKDKLKKTVGDGVRSSYTIISIAGETLALTDTGIDPSEKMYHNKDDFKRLYVPEEIEDQQQALEEILIRMFPLTSAQSKKQVLPPEDEDEFNLVRQSLYYRMALLRDEILKDKTNSVDIREKLSRFDRLNKLLDSLESNFHKKRTQTYLAIVTSSSAPPRQGDPKIEMNDETVDDLLRKFGLILLQSQHQLPGFEFPVPPNQIVRQVQSVLLPDEDAFIAEAQKEGKVQTSIEDVLHPDEKEKRILKSLRDAFLKKLEPLMESLGEETAAGLHPDISDLSKPFGESLDKFIESLFTTVQEFQAYVRNGNQQMEIMDQTLDALNIEKENCYRQLRELQDKETKASKKATDADSLRKADKAAFETGAKKLRTEIEDKNSQIRIIEAQMTALQEQLRQKEAAAEAVATLTPELERLREDVKTKAQTIEALQAKEAELEPLRQRVAELEKKESLTKAEEKTLATTTSTLESVSEQRQKLEEKLAEYNENIEQLQLLINRIPGPPPAEGTSPFDILKQRILSALPSAHLIPSVLEIESEQKTYTCKFLEALLQLFQKYFDSEEGLDLQNRLTEQLDILHEGKTRAVLAKGILLYLQYANGKEIDGIDSSESPFPGNQLLKDIATRADVVFFKGQEDLRGTVQELNVRLAGKDLPSYPVFFFLYLLALRDWVNCIDLSSRPGKCPIPERLQRTLRCP